MNTVFVLQHLHRVNGDEDDVKMLGVYSSREEALAAIERFRRLSGFRDTPQLAVHTDAPADPEGFYLDEHELDRDSWSEGYETV
jgi:hypothetical protein